MTANFTEKASGLHIQVDSFQKFHWRNHEKYNRYAIAVIAGGLLVSLATTISAFLGYSICAGVLGLGTTLFIGLQDAFNFSEKSAFFLNIHAEAKTVRDRLKYQIQSDKDFNEVFDQFQKLRQRASQEIPKGKGITVISRGAAEA